MLDPPRHLKPAAQARSSTDPPAPPSGPHRPSILNVNLVYAATGDSYTDVDINTSDAIWPSTSTPASSYGRARCWRKTISRWLAVKPRGYCPETRGPDYDFGTSPALRSIGGGKDLLIVGQKSGILWALDPDDKGKIVWQTRVGLGGALGGIEWGHATDDKNAYAPISDRFKAPRLIERRRS